MNADSFILQVRKSNAALFAARRMTITPAALEKLMRQAYAAGHRDGRNGTTPPSLFETLFGK